jgi:hypothetical protein
MRDPRVWTLLVGAVQRASNDPEILSKVAQYEMAYRMQMWSR